MFLSGPGVSTFPSTLMNYIEYNYDPTVSAVSVLLMAATVIIMVIIDRTLGIAAPVSYTHLDVYKRQPI